MDIMVWLALREKNQSISGSSLKRDRLQTHTVLNGKPPFTTTLITKTMPQERHPMNKEKSRV
jgi:hypothetical protein